MSLGGSKPCLVDRRGLRETLMGSLARHTLISRVRDVSAEHRKHFLTLKKGARLHKSESGAQTRVSKYSKYKP